ncbi:MAG: undecaprenyl/decaprenyl-phosphate alpha-N-acetylglucosaminyl 1-phosphate transferase [Planctomyces sp.]|nr:undecaprenyl/decaprenyl-phosphate alpha-N-acetylglucosaminyl 1-phosphate transferase [Planctomyces sp.]
MLEFFLGGFVLPFMIAAVGVPMIRALAPVLGLIDQPGERKVHFIPTPRSGGIAIFAGIVLTLIVWAVIWSSGLDIAGTLRDLLLESVQGNPERIRQFLAIGIGGGTLFFVGLADDRWNLSWKLRLGCQLLVAVFVVAMGVRATVFVSQPWFGWGVSILWILVLTNALNFLDNMDALSAGIGVIASLIFCAIMIELVGTPVWSVAFLLIVLAGSLSGFLLWNRPPASIFMGDCGSNLIGFLLSTLTIVGTFYDRTGSRHVMLAPLCVLAVPLYDFSTVILIRLRQGRSPFQGDKSHFSHRLVELGLRPASAVLTIHLTTMMTGLAGLLLYKVPDWTGAGLVVGLVICVLSIIAILETVGRSAVSRSQQSPSQQSRSVERDPAANSIERNGESGVETSVVHPL